ncbi:TPM domain-containing protein [Lysobacter sp. A6]|uniref:TPM domain-containing protein n=1 Tax=Noviluteimonas lactosilytica TaxID=2888523 RepID=A0ABS8JKG9_9GAMM|nr:TPM domain-containing protein [Lysobacter lactosilyticus]
MRLFRHLFARSADAWLPAEAMERITAAIDAGELRHSGEICFAVEPALHWRHVLRGTPVRERAEQAFAKLRVWDTEGNTGVLLYVLLADHRLEIVADRGLRGIDPAQWRAVCETIEAGLRADDPATAIVHGIDAISDLLAGQAPRIEGREDRDELSNRPRIL